MTKKEFLEKLEHKLHLLKRDEIQDILDEYSGYIDNKLQEGKTEDEAVADFGNLDDLAREILSAYKIDAKYTRDSSRDIIDNVVNVMTQGIDSAVSYFTQHFNDLSMEAVIRLIALILIALVVVGLMKIPFSLLETILVSLLRAILPGFLAATLNFFVRLTINLIYLCLVVLVLASFISQGLENKEITLRDLFKKPLVFEFGRRHDDACSPQRRAAQTVNSDAEAKEKVERQKEAEAFDQAEAAEATVDQNLTEITESLEEEDLEERILEEPIDPLIQPRTHYPYYNNEEKTKKKHGWGIGKAAAWLMIGIVQLITLLILIPFGLGEFGFCFGFGLLVFLLFQGAKLWGLTLICLGLIGIFQAIVSGLWRIVRPATKKRPYLIALIASVILTGIGVPLMMIEFSSYEEVPVRQDFPELCQPQTIHLMQTDELDRVYLSFHFDEVVFRENPKLSYGSLQLILPPGNYEQRYNDLPDPPDYEYSKTVNIVSTQEGAGEFRTGLEIFLRGLREGKWYQDDQDYGMGHVLIVEASQPTLSQLTMDENQTVLHINP